MIESSGWLLLLPDVVADDVAMRGANHLIIIGNFEFYMQGFCLRRSGTCSVVPYVQKQKSPGRFSAE